MCALLIWTLGHSTRTLDEFINLLRINHIALVADVRRFPGSRKMPQFKDSTLAAALRAHGFEYRHFPDLGGRRRPRPDSKNLVWRNEAFRGYADYMESEEFRGALKQLLAVAKEKPTALMCAEAVWWRCHRALISDALKARGLQVCHIMSATRVAEHPYTSAARLVNGELVYSEPGA